ncbi:MAG: DUF2157 domain-containing protein [Fretibacterium sp.]|nr:DUF2157 domain-containing protein [Fretibacterium sp.]
MRLIKSREMSFLEGELGLWLESGLLSREQAAGIRGLYGVRRQPLFLILLEAGGALVGLGIISFAAANWQEMSRFLRTLLFAGAYLACLIAAWGLRRKSPRAARTFLLLANLVYGAGLFLIAHLYYSGLEWRDLMRYWLGGVLLFALLFRDPWQALLSQAVALVYFIGTDAVSLFKAGALLPASNFFMPVETWPFMGALWAAALWTRGRMVFYTLILLTLTVAESRVRLCFGTSAGLAVMAGVGAALSFLPVQKWSWGDNWNGLLSYSLLGVVMAGTFGLALTYPECWGDFFTKIPPFTSVRILAAGTTGLLALLMLWQFHRGLTAGGTFLILLAARYFFDGIFDLMSRAWGFTVIGISCLAVGILLNWQRKRTGMEEVPQQHADKAPATARGIRDQCSKNPNS